MTNDVALQAPAGWYPDPADASSQRWWDGVRWTGHVVPALRPYGGDLEPQRFDMSDYILRSMTDPTAMVLMYLDPWYLGSVVVGWVAYGATVLLAYFDYAALSRLGYGRRFHWAWTFLSSLVYVIGRSVLVRRQAGRGSAPMHVAIWSTVAVFVATMAWATVMTVEAMSGIIEVAETYGTRL
ncbi:MAG: DUF2510 domain-containing protein [Agromyces sp.]|nr:DUF2510 domain-containing protein [Agromyces sp.]